MIAALAGAAYLGVRLADGPEEAAVEPAGQRLWAEATDPVPPCSRSWAETGDGGHVARG